MNNVNNINHVNNIDKILSQINIIIPTDIKLLIQTYYDILTIFQYNNRETFKTCINQKIYQRIFINNSNDVDFLICGNNRYSDESLYRLHPKYGFNFLSIDYTKNLIRCGPYGRQQLPIDLKSDIKIKEDIKKLRTELSNIYEDKYQIQHEKNEIVKEAKRNFFRELSIIERKIYTAFLDLIKIELDNNDYELRGYYIEEDPGIIVFFIQNIIHDFTLEFLKHKSNIEKPLTKENQKELLDPDYEQIRILAEDVKRYFQKDIRKIVELENDLCTKEEYEDLDIDDPKKQKFRLKYLNHILCPSLKIKIINYYKEKGIIVNPRFSAIFSTNVNRLVNRLYIKVINTNFTGIYDTAL